MTETEQEMQWRREFEDDGEQTVRDSLNSGIIGLATADADKQKFARRWLREKEREREVYARRTFRVAVATFWVAVATLIAAAVSFFVHPS